MLDESMESRKPFECMSIGNKDGQAPITLWQNSEFVHFVVSFTRGSCLLPKQVLHIVQCSSSSFSFHSHLVWIWTEKLWEANRVSVKLNTVWWSIIFRNNKYKYKYIYIYKSLSFFNLWCLMTSGSRNGRTVFKVCSFMPEIDCSLYCIPNCGVLHPRKLVHSEPQMSVTDLFISSSYMLFAHSKVCCVWRSYLSLTPLHLI